MAKKTFKKGLGSLIQDTRKSLEEEPQNVEQEQNEDNDTYLIRLMNQIGLLANELSLWRTGKLNVELFHSSLTEHGLQYNESKNCIEIAKQAE